MPLLDDLVDEYAAPTASASQSPSSPTSSQSDAPDALDAMIDEHKAAAPAPSPAAAPAQSPDDALLQKSLQDVADSGVDLGKDFKKPVSDAPKTGAAAYIAAAANMADPALKTADEQTTQLRISQRNTLRQLVGQVGLEKAAQNPEIAKIAFNLYHGPQQEEAGLQQMQEKRAEEGGAAGAFMENAGQAGFQMAAPFVRGASILAADNGSKGAKDFLVLQDLVAKQVALAGSKHYGAGLAGQAAGLALDTVGGPGNLLGKATSKATDPLLSAVIGPAETSAVRALFSKTPAMKVLTRNLPDNVIRGGLNFAVQQAAPLILSGQPYSMEQFTKDALLGAMFHSVNQEGATAERSAYGVKASEAVRAVETPPNVTAAPEAGVKVPTAPAESMIGSEHGGYPEEQPVATAEAAPTPAPATLDLGDLPAQMSDIRREKWDSLTPEQKTALLNQPARPKADLAPEAVRTEALARINEHLDAMQAPAPESVLKTMTEFPDSPPVRTVAEAEAAHHGVKFDGFQEGAEEGQNLLLFTDPKSGDINPKNGKPRGTTIALMPGEDLGAKLVATREKFAKKAENAAAAKAKLEALLKPEGVADAGKVEGATGMGGERAGVGGAGGVGPEGVSGGERGAETARPRGSLKKAEPAGGIAESGGAAKPQKGQKLDEGVNGKTLIGTLPSSEGASSGKELRGSLQASGGRPGGESPAPIAGPSQDAGSRPGDSHQAIVDSIKQAASHFQGVGVESDGTNIHLTMPDLARVPYRVAEKISVSPAQLQDFLESAHAANEGKSDFTYMGSSYKLPKTVEEWRRLSTWVKRAINDIFRPVGNYDQKTDAIHTTKDVVDDHTIAAEEIFHRHAYSLKKANHSIYDAMIEKYGSEDAAFHAYLDAKNEGEFFDRIRGGTAHVGPEKASITQEIGKPKKFGKTESGSMFAVRKGEGEQNKREEVWYSHAERTLAEKMGGSGNALQVRAMLLNAGVKPEEMKWSGLDDYLNSHGTVKKAEILDYLRKNAVQVQEVMKGGESKASPEMKEWVGTDLPSSSKAWTELSDKLTSMAQRQQRQGNADRAEKFFRLSEEATHQAEALDTGARIGQTKFSQYQLPGGADYRELLLTLPQKERAAPPEYDWRKNAAGKWAWFDGDRQITGAFPSESWKEESRPRDVGSDAANFRSSHFDEPNVLAHIRFNTRTDAAGKKTLFIEEVQSDWHQKGRDVGYRPEKEARLAELVKRRDQLMALGADATPAQKQEWAAAMNEISTLARGDVGVPDAPFKKTWHEMAMRRMLRYAAENGYDQLAWTTGEMQNERYDLSKQVDEIRYVKSTEGEQYSIRAVKDGETLLIEEGISPSRVVDLVGKDIGKRIDRGEGDPTGEPSGEVVLRGDNLKVGGEGMKGFYDKIIPDYLNKYGKKWGAKVGDAELKGAIQDYPTYDENGTRIDSGKYFRENVHALPITDPMKESVMGGQRLFAVRKRPESPDEPGKPKRLTERQIIREASIKPTETIKGTIKRTAGVSPDDGPTIPVAEALKIKLKALQKALGSDPTPAETAYLEARDAAKEMRVPKSESTLETVERTTGTEDNALSAKKLVAKLTAEERGSYEPGIRADFLADLREATTQKQIDRAVDKQERAVGAKNLSEARGALRETVGPIKRESKPKTMRDKLDKALAGQKEVDPFEGGRIDPKKQTPAARDALTDIVGSLREKDASIDGAGKLADFIQGERDAGHSNDAGMTETDLATLRALNGKKASDLSPEETKLVTQAIQHVAHLGEQFNEANANSRAAEVKAQRDEMAKGLLEYHPEKLKPGMRGGLAVEPRRNPIANFVGNAFRDPFRFLKLNLGKGGEKMWRRLVDGQTKAFDSINQAKDMLTLAREKAGITDKQWREMSQTSRTISLGFRQVKLSPREIMSFINGWGRPTTQRDMLRAGIVPKRLKGETLETFHINDSDAQKIMDAATPAEKAVAKAMQEHMVSSQLHKDANAATVREAGYEKLTEPGYWPRARAWEQAPGEVVENMKQLRDAQLKDLGFLKDAPGTIKAPVLLEDAGDVFTRHISELARFAHLNDSTRDLAMIMADPEFSGEAKSRLGRQFAKQLSDTIQRLTGMEDHVDIPGAKLLAAIRGRIATGELMFRLTSAINHFNGGILAVNKIPEGSQAAFLKNFAAKAVPDMKMIREMEAHNAYLRNRGTQKGGDLESPVDVETPPKGKLGRFLDTAGEVGTAHIRLSDRMDSASIYKTFLDKYKAEHPSADAAEARTWAAKQTEYVVRMTGTASTPFENSYFAQRVSRIPVMNLLTLFQSKTSVMRNVIDEAVQDWRVNKTPANAKKVATAAATVAVMTATYAAVGMLSKKVRQGFQTQTDADEKKAMLSEAVQVGAHIADIAAPGVGGGMVRDLHAAITGSSQNADIVTEAVMRSVQDFTAAAKSASDGDMGKMIQKIIDALNSAGKLFGISAEQPTQYIEGLMGLNEKKGKRIR